MWGQRHRSRTANYDRQVVRSPQVTFPHDQHVPPLLTKQRLISGVPGPIAGQLCAPILLIRLWSLATGLAVMPMPEAAVNKNDLAPLRKHQVGISRQVFAVQPVAIPQTVHESPHPHLRLRVLTVHPGHCEFALLCGEVVSINWTHSPSISRPASTVKQFSPVFQASQARRGVGGARALRVRFAKVGRLLPRWNSYVPFTYLSKNAYRALRGDHEVAVDVVVSLGYVYSSTGFRLPGRLRRRSVVLMQDLHERRPLVSDLTRGLWFGGPLSLGLPQAARQGSAVTSA